MAGKRCPDSPSPIPTSYGVRDSPSDATVVSLTAAGEDGAVAHEALALRALCQDTGAPGNLVVMTDRPGVPPPIKAKSVM